MRATPHAESMMHPHQGDDVMRHRSKLLLTALSATVVLGALVSAASANRIALSNQSFTATWTSLEFVEPIGLIAIRCPVTIEGSFHSSTISKVLEQLIGYVTHGAVAETRCTGGSARILPESLPWHIRYNGFAGTLPAITRINLRLVGAAFLIQIPLPEGMQRCLYKSTAASPFKGVVNRNTTTGAAENLEPETARVPLFSETLRDPGAPACFASGGLRSRTTALTVQNSTTKITVTLVT
jgi:hypothetical protein